jgi:UDP-N-acetylmuramoyl-tripeptide--D-alanyl-D-alanine ligase
LVALAFLWRTLLVRTTFVAITGSLGKTTCKDCLAVMLARVGPTIHTLKNRNGRGGVARTLLRVRPWHRFAVIEIGTDRPGGLIRGSLLIRPHIVVILKVAPVHVGRFRTLEEIAAEKAKLLRFLRPGGTAVLNGDDPMVAAMAGAVRGRAVLFGGSDRFDVWGCGASSRWPERLQFTACRGEERVAVKTRLVGTHWLSSVVGAVAAATVCGAGFQQAAEAVLEVEPFTARMQPVELPGGAILLRDEYNGSLDSFEAALEVLRQAGAQRRVLIISDCSYDKDKPRDRMKHYARAAVGCAEVVVFVGDRARYGLEYSLRAGLPQETHAFTGLEAAAEFLKKEARSGDLLLLRGRTNDHLSRIYFGMLGHVDCRKVTCARHRLCDECTELGFQPRAESTLASLCAE